MKKWNVGWGTVAQCNMNCAFCYSKEKRKQASSVGLDDWIRFVDENHLLINTINYGTGENTLDPDWFRLILHIRENYPEIRQALTTNGYLSKAVENDFNYEAFAKSIDEVDVSLDFAEEEKHIAFRGQPHAYQWAINTMKLCQKLEKPLTIVFLGSQQNVTHENIDGLFSIAKEYNAILRMNMYRPTEGISEHSKPFIISYDTFMDAIEYISKKYTILSINDALFSSILTGKTVDDPSGDKSIRILADGSITPSTYLIKDSYIVGNIKEEKILQRLEEQKSISLIVKKTIPDDCQKCVYHTQCAGGVYDRRYLWYGTLSHKDPYCPGAFLKVSEHKIATSKSGFQSVHDGYLPTIFFKP